MKYVYVAGPYTGDIMTNIRNALKVGSRLLDAELVPYVPHLSGFWDLLYPRPYADWMKLDLAWLERCEAVYRLRGDSPGADQEVKAAKKLGIPVFYEPFIQGLLDACGST